MPAVLLSLQKADCCAATLQTAFDSQQPLQHTAVLASDSLSHRTSAVLSQECERAVCRAWTEHLASNDPDDQCRALAKAARSLQVRRAAARNVQRVHTWDHDQE